MPNIITVNNLTKRYGGLIAVDAISFSVKEGETFGLVGPNGAGKTTTLEMIEGLRTIDQGSVVLDGFDVAQQARQVKARIGVQLQKSDFFEHLNLPELLEVFASLYNRRVDARAILKQVQLTEKEKSQVKELSGGQKQRFSIAAALVNDPRVLFLDEPTTGLDPQARRNLWQLVEEIKARGKTIILTTHYMEEAEVLCDRIAIMDHAKIIALDTTANLLAQSGVESTITFNSDKDFPQADFKTLPGVVGVEREDNTTRLLTNSPEQTLPALYLYQQQRNAKVLGLHLDQATLEDVFLQLTGRALRE